MRYDLRKHRHRFAVWAAARAVQRRFPGATVERLRDALEATDLRSFLESRKSLNVGRRGYETRHRRWCNQIIASLKKAGVPSPTFGRAAKLVAVYVKAMIITPEAAYTRLAMAAHPPIDRVLLHGLAGPQGEDSPHRAYWQSVAWTQLNEEDYYTLVEQLRAVLLPGEPFWMLEKYWTVTMQSGSAG